MLKACRYGATCSNMIFHMVNESIATPSWYPGNDNYYEISLSQGFDRLCVRRRQLNNLTSPSLIAANRVVYDIDEVEGKEEGDGKHNDPNVKGFIGDE